MYTQMKAITISVAGRLRHYCNDKCRERITVARKRVLGLVRITKDGDQSSALVAQMVKPVSYFFFDASDTGSDPPFGELFFSLFKFHITSEKHLFSIKKKEMIKKLKIN